MDALIGGRYRIGRKVGSGSFGDIFLGTNSLTGEEVALKRESTRSRHPQLLYEAKVYKLLVGGVGVPAVHWYGVEGEFTYMVLDLLGPSLEDLLNMCNRALSLKTVLMIADQLVNRLEYVHAKGILHRDVKPDNFLVGLGRRSSQVHVIDFGLAKKYRDSKSQQHIPYREDKALTGTARYASINTHRGIEQSRRDDLEAVGYVLVYLLRGKLPWQGLPGRTKEDKYEQIMRKKIDTPLDVLCRRLPAEFTTYLSYCRGLRFEDRPDYAYLRRTLRDLFLREGHTYDSKFDWSALESNQQPERPKSAAQMPRDVVATPTRAFATASGSKIHRDAPLTCTTATGTTPQGSRLYRDTPVTSAPTTATAQAVPIDPWGMRREEVRAHDQFESKRREELRGQELRERRVQEIRESLRHPHRQQDPKLISSATAL